MLLSAKRKINEKDYMRIINETVYNPFFSALKTQICRRLYFYCTTHKATYCFYNSCIQHACKLTPNITIALINA